MAGVFGSMYMYKQRRTRRFLEMVCQHAIQTPRLTRGRCITHATRIQRIHKSIGTHTHTQSTHANKHFFSPLLSNWEQMMFHFSAIYPFGCEFQTGSCYVPNLNFQQLSIVFFWLIVDWTNSSIGFEPRTTNAIETGQHKTLCGAGRCWAYHWSCVNVISEYTRNCIYVNQRIIEPVAALESAIFPGARPVIRPR